MSRWPRGEAEVEQLVARRELELVAGAGADGSPLLTQASKTVATAAVVVRNDAYSAYVLAYDAARFACGKSARGDRTRIQRPASLVRVSSRAPAKKRRRKATRMKPMSKRPGESHSRFVS